MFRGIRQAPSRGGHHPDTPRDPLARVRAMKKLLLVLVLIGLVGVAAKQLSSS